MIYEPQKSALWDYMRRRPGLGRKSEIVLILLAGLAAIVAIVFSFR
jgi:hypothetical protein